MMDRLSAHLDRGWDMVARGETTKALLAARQALDLDDQSPEAYNLLGYVLAVDGNIDDAIDAYGKAIDLDEWYLEPILNSAELLAHPDGDPEEAIRLCRRTEEMVLSPVEKTDAILIEADALFSLDRLDEARERLSSVDPRDPLPQPYLVAMARLLIDLEELEAAAAFAERAVAATPESGDARYTLGVVAREQGRRIDAVRAFLAARELDLAIPPAEWMPSEEQLCELIGHVVRRLPEEMRRMLKDTEIRIERLPSEEQLRSELDERQILLARDVDPERGRFEHLWVFSANLESFAAPTTLEDDLERLIALEIGAGEQLPFERNGD
ncbi:MAG: tetratricopeptide repeat protein [Polyangia bacterium]